MTSSTLLPPRLVSPAGHKAGDVLECSIHTLPKPLLREFRHVFGDQYLINAPESDSERQLLAIPTNQRARQDLVGVGDHIEQEKDRLLNLVRHWMMMMILYMNRYCDLCFKDDASHISVFVICSSLTLHGNCARKCGHEDIGQTLSTLVRVFP